MIHFDSFPIYTLIAYEQNICTLFSNNNSKIIKSIYDLDPRRCKEKQFKDDGAYRTAASFIR